MGNGRKGRITRAGGLAQERSAGLLLQPVSTSTLGSSVGLSLGGSLELS